MKRAAGVALALSLVVALAPRAWAKGEDEEEEASEDEEGGDEGEEEGEEEGGGEETEGKGKEAVKEAEDLPDDGLRPKQNLTGHDLGTSKKATEFEANRFFVDKVDTEKTEKGTLVQGSIASSSFAYLEKGGAYETPASQGDNTGPARFFTELRLQTDFRHIAASRWDARIDARARFVNSADPGTNGTLTDPNRIQSGFNGENEYEIRELWLTRVGRRSDIFLGRQFIADLGAIKFDGLRVDYAKSAKLTIIAFGGLYPVRGSRSIDTDYVELKEPQSLNPVGRFIVATGGGGAYRTVNAYGAVGVVALAPLKAESPRIYVTSSGYLRSGSKLDLYHFGLIDVFSASGFQLTNISLGANFKPSQRLRLTANVHRVDTETLNLQAGAFLNAADTMMGGATVVQNEAYIQRLATNAARLGVSAGLGSFQRFEISTAMTYRRRDEFTLTTPSPMDTDPKLPAATSVEVWGSIVDRRSIKNTRIGLDGSRTFGLGTQSFQRSTTSSFRLFALRELANGRGEWEGEVTYGTVTNDALGAAACTGAAAVGECFGASNSTLLSAGGQLVYRLRRDWLAIGNGYLLRTANTRAGTPSDPTTYGITAFLRIAKRF